MGSKFDLLIDLGPRFQKSRIVEDVFWAVGFEKRLPRRDDIKFGRPPRCADLVRGS